jgi:hypothetical protein
MKKVSTQSATGALLNRTKTNIQSQAQSPATQKLATAFRFENTPICF